MAQVTLKKGNPINCDYTAGATITAGDVIVTSVTPRVALHDIANGDLGALSVFGGIYECTGDAAIATDKKVYWVDASNKVSEDANSGANKAFGMTVSACSGDGSTCLVFHNPAQ
jgi:predicted RecA/RadA family phage recombinase